jgi:signal transduction histidine kinase
LLAKNQREITGKKTNGPTGASPSIQRKNGEEEKVTKKMYKKDGRVCIINSPKKATENMAEKPKNRREDKMVFLSTPFLAASFHSFQGIVEVRQVSSSFYQAFHLDDRSSLNNGFWALFSSEEKARFTSALAFATLYADEGESANCLVHLADKEAIVQPYQTMAKAKKKEDGSYRVEVIFNPQPLEKKPSVPLALGEKCLSGVLLGEINGDLSAGTIAASNVKEMAFLPDVPEGTSYEDFVKILIAVGLADSEKEAEFRAFFDPKALEKAYQEGTRECHYRLRLALTVDTPLWLDYAFLLKEDEQHHLLFSLSILDISEPMLEKEMMTRLPLFGIDVLGLVYLPNEKCRYYRIEKMGLGMANAATRDYQEAILDDIDVLVAKDDVDEVKEALSLVHIKEELKTRPSYTTAYTLLRRDGTKRRKRFQFTYLDEKKQTLFFVRSDLTANYLKEQEQIAKLEAAKQKIEEAYDSKSIFLSSMSHDIRSPLNGILSFTELALQEKDPVKKDKDIELTRSSGDFLLGLVNDTLDLSRYESGKAEMNLASLSLRDAFETVLTALRGAAQIKTITIVVDGEVPDVYVETDGLKFEKVFLNLLSNAIKYTPSGGEIHVSLRAHEKDQHGCNYTLSVRDNGIGIEPKFMPHIFEAFSQENRQESKNILGTGLGLAIVKRIVTMMAGTIEVESQVHKGTTFRVSFPFAPAEKVQKEVKENIDDVSFTGLHVLVAEDNAVNLQIETILLESKGLIVTGVVNGELALQEFKKSKPGFYRAIFLDNQMPVMGGIETAKRIRALKRNEAKSIPLIALTGDAFQEDIAAFYAAGMDGVIVKPVDSYRLFSLLKKLLNKEKK